MGWHVAVTDDLADLRSFFKNGKPRKSAEVSLARSEVWIDEFYDREAGASVERIRESVLPYRVESRFVPGWAFDRCDKAVTVFMEEAQTLAPASGDAREQILAARKIQQASSSWHGEPPSERQLRYAKNLGIDVRKEATKGEVSKLIDAAENQEDDIEDIDMSADDELVVEVDLARRGGCLSLAVVALAGLVVSIVFVVLW